MGNKLKLWIKAVRAPFFTATASSAVLGAVIAWHHTGSMNWGYFLLTILGAILLNTGTNLANDYFDHTSSLDEKNENLTPFSGGSRVIQDKLISPKKILYVGIIAFVLAGIIGLYLNFKVAGNVILIIGVIGVLLGYFYTAPPFRLGYIPLGEVVSGFCCGPLIVYGSYYVQAQSLSWRPFGAAVTIGILVSLILFINEFPDHDADKRVNKKTLIVVMGKEKAIKVYYLLLGLVYVVVVLGVILRNIPVFSLIVFITLPLVFKAIKVARSNYDKIQELIPANAATIGLHLIVAVLLIGSYILDRLI